MMAKWTGVTFIASVALIVVLCDRPTPARARSTGTSHSRQRIERLPCAPRVPAASRCKPDSRPRAGGGPAHGYAETSRMWRPLMPRLAEHFTVIAPDLPGIGGSDIPSDGLDMTHAAVRIHELVKGAGDR